MQPASLKCPSVAYVVLVCTVQCSVRLLLMDHAMKDTIVYMEPIPPLQIKEPWLMNVLLAITVQQELLLQWNAPGVLIILSQWLDHHLIVKTALQANTVIHRA